jgi:hypothetical protein
VTKNTRKEKKYFTSAQDRLWELLLRMKSDKKFQDDLKRLRKLHNIPESGFKDLPIDYTHLGYASFNFPQEWVREIDNIDTEAFSSDVNNLVKDHKLGALDVQACVMDWILFYDKYHLPDNAGNVVLLDMVKTRKNLRNKKIKENHAFPVGIMVNPYASINEIKEYIDVNSKKIKNIQERYKDRVAPLRQTRMREMHKVTRLILNLHFKQEKEPKEIIPIVQKRFGIIFSESDIRSKIHHHKDKYR